MESTHTLVSGLSPNGLLSAALLESCDRIALNDTPTPRHNSR